MLRKKVLLGLWIFAFSSTVFANCMTKTCFVPGLYFGAGAGWARADEGDGISKAIDVLFDENMGLNSSKDVDQGGFVGGRGYLGYQFAEIFGIEAGYSYYPNNSYKAQGLFPTTFRFDFRYRTQVIDTMVKLMFPFALVSDVFSHFTIFARGGAAFLMNEFSGSFQIGSSGGSTTGTNNSFRPTFGVGLAYNFTENTSIDISWTGILGYNRLSYGDVIDGNIRKNPVPNCNLYAAGFSYKFTNL